MPTEEMTYRQGVQSQLTTMDEKLDEVLRQARYTNGKVRKIIIVLFLIGGIIIGQTFSNAHDIIQLVANFV
jgi:hypothetical protein